METNRDARVIAAVRALGDDRVIAGVRAARDAYAAMHGHDIAAIFEDIRAFQETSDREYVRNVERLAQAATPIAAQVSEAARQMARSLGPAMGALKAWSAAAAPFREEFERTAKAAAAAMERIRPALKQFYERKQTHDALNEVGWLPHYSVPHQLVAGCEGDRALLDSRVAEHYRTRWTKIRDNMELDLATYHIDDEARATFREALMAHESGLYRCICRLLFPEIERIIGAGHRSGPMIQTLLASGEPTKLDAREMFDWVMLERIREYAYEQVWTEGERERFERDPVPNRHAAIHGQVAYSTHKHSMNMLILTDYVFRILPPLDDSHT
jgi:hypothetical protein